MNTNNWNVPLPYQNTPAIDITEWRPVGRKKRRNGGIDPERVYIRCRKNKRGRIIMMVSIGLGIMNRFGWIQDTRVELLRHPHKPSNFMVRMSGNDDGYSLNIPKCARAGSFQATVDDDYRYELDISLSVAFWLHNNAIVMDIASFNPTKWTHV